MYIYSSICQPIQVGSTRVPLSKSIWLDNKKNVGRANFGEVRNITTENPMYIPISVLKLILDLTRADYFHFQTELLQV